MKVIEIVVVTKNSVEIHRADDRARRSAIAEKRRGDERTPATAAHRVENAAEKTESSDSLSGGQRGAGEVEKLCSG